MAIGHPDSTLVSEAAALAAAAALETVGLTATGPEGCGEGLGAATAGRPRSGLALLPGEIVCGAVGNRPASACPGAPTAAGPGAAASSRPGSAAKKKASAKKGQGALRRSSSAGSGISSAWDNAQIGVMPPSGGACASATANAQDAHAETAAAAGPAPVGAVDCTSLGLTNPFCPKATRARQKRMHVPGSGVFGPGVMAALQHIKGIQATDAAAVSGHDVNSSSSSSLCARSSDQSSPPSVGAQAVQAANVAGSSDGRFVTGGLTVKRASLFQPGGAAAAGSILSRSAAATATDSSGSSRGVDYQDGFRVRPRSACARAGTAADVYWQQPEHSATATGAALSGLLPTLFTGELAQEVLARLLPAFKGDDDS